MLTFSRNARAQLEGYAAEILTAEQHRLTEITNYHSWFWAKLSQFQRSLGLPAQLEIASDAQREEEVRAVMAAEGVTVIDSGKGRNLGDYSHVLEYEFAPGRPERLPERSKKESRWPRACWSVSAPQGFCTMTTSPTTPGGCSTVPKRCANSGATSTR